MDVRVERLRQRVADLEQALQWQRQVTRAAELRAEAAEQSARTAWRVGTWGGRRISDE